MSNNKGFGNDQPSSLGLGFKAALVGISIMIAVTAANLLFFKVALLYAYPIQLILYFVVGRTAGIMAKNADPNRGFQINSASDINFASIGGTAGGILSLLTWLLYAAVSLGMDMLILGGFSGGVFGIAICAIIDILIGIGLGVWGGTMARPPAQFGQ
jgi:hypothetical protein